MRRTRRKLTPLLLVLALFAPAGVAPEPAGALDATATGNATFAGTAVLPQFPCPNDCTGGTFSGIWAGHLAGVDAGLNPFDVSWRTLAAGTVSASFSYEETLCFQGVETVLGKATGTGLAEAIPGEIVGFWTSKNGDELPRAIDRVKLTFNFDWVRVGNSALVQVKPGSILEILPAGLAWVRISDDEQDGVASFAPTHSSTTGVPSCASPLQNVEGLIVGDLTLTGRPA